MLCRRFQRRIGAGRQTHPPLSRTAETRHFIPVCHEEFASQISRLSHLATGPQKYTLTLSWMVVLTALLPAAKSRLVFFYVRLELSLKMPQLISCSRRIANPFKLRGRRFNLCIAYLGNGLQNRISVFFQALQVNADRLLDVPPYFIHGVAGSNTPRKVGGTYAL